MQMARRAFLFFARQKFYYILAPFHENVIELHPGIGSKNMPGSLLQDLNSLNSEYILHRGYVSNEGRIVIPDDWWSMEGDHARKSFARSKQSNFVRRRKQRICKE
jgi:hypothetical protein